MFDLSKISKVTSGKTRLFSAENVYGEKGKGGMADYSDTPQKEVVKIGQQWKKSNPAARELGQKWKVRPCIDLAPRICNNNFGHKRTGKNYTYLVHGR